MNITILAPWTDYHPQQAPRPWLIAFLAQQNWRRNQRLRNTGRRSAEIRIWSDGPSWEQWLHLAARFVESGEWIIG